MNQPLPQLLGAMLLGLALLIAAPAAAQTETPGARQDLRKGGKIALDSNVDPVQVESGALVYAAKCSFCHGLDLAGSTRRSKDRAGPAMIVPPLGLTSRIWRYPEPMLRNLVRFGENVFVRRRSAAVMPAHRDILEVAEIESVLAFVKAHWTPEMRERQADITARAAEVERRFDRGLPLLPNRRSGE